MKSTLKKVGRLLERFTLRPLKVSLRAVGLLKKKNRLDNLGSVHCSSDRKATVDPEAAKRILVADYRIPRPEVSAGETATLGILRDLCQLGYSVTFLPKDMEASPVHEAPLNRLGVHVVTKSSGFQQCEEYLAKHGSQFGAFYIIRFDVAERMLAPIRTSAPKSRIIFHAPDLYHLRETREAELSGDSRALARALETKRRELAVMERCHRVVVVSPAEVDVLASQLPHTPISLFPALYSPVVRAPPGPDNRKDVFFLGGFKHTPNVNAVKWFATEVWPHIRSRIPQAEFQIIGAEAPDEVLKLSALPGVRVVGFVDDLEPALQTLRVGVAPLLFGAGIKGKVGMTLGAGIPCVCTPIAAEGMGIVDGVHSLIASDARSFADAVVIAYTDAGLWHRLSTNGQALVRRHFSDEANRSSLLRLLDDAEALPLQLYIDHCKQAPPCAMPPMDAFDRPDVSIIIPVFNKWHLTRACLISVIHTSFDARTSFEIILADDGSTDDTSHAATFFPGVKVVQTPHNVGFLRNCNHAAGHARGEHFLFLNNDTIVLPGWLDSLRQTLEEDRFVAIAGSKLLYPDGTIQEAGAALFQDGTAINLGRGKFRRDPSYQFACEADYISGASILVRGSFWRDIGGFDERYRNAYCEDSDLAMTARKHGLRVVYQPRSEVVHFEHQSYADQAPTHNSELQSHNIALLLDKWRDTFQRSHRPPCEWHLAAANADRAPMVAGRRRRTEGRLNVLYFSPFPSHPPSHGNRATINQFARLIQGLGHKVHFVVLQSNDFNDQDRDDMAASWDSLEILPFSNPMVADGRNIDFDGWYADELGEGIRILCARHDIDVVLCSYVFQSKLLEFVPSHVLKVIDTHDKMGDRYEMLRAHGLPLEFFSCTPAEEGHYLRRADIVVARRQEEADYFNLVTGRASATVIPHIEPPRFTIKAFRQLHHLGLVASPNRINLAITRDFLSRLVGKTANSKCPFVVHIAGNVRDMLHLLPADDADLFRSPCVKLCGFVPDLETFYGEMDAVVSPVTLGTGINVKTVQALAYGMPLITTSVGIKGIDSDEPLHQIADLDSLVDELLWVHAHPEKLEALAAASRALYQRFWERGQSALSELFSHPKVCGDTNGQV